MDSMTSSHFQHTLSLSPQTHSPLYEPQKPQEESKLWQYSAFSCLVSLKKITLQSSVSNKGFGKTWPHESSLLWQNRLISMRTSLELLRELFSLWKTQTTQFLSCILIYHLIAQKEACRSSGLDSGFSRTRACTLCKCLMPVGDLLAEARFGLL